MTRDYAVVIPTYDRYADCLRAIRSALSQTVPPLEVVVVDDGSTDERYEWIEEIVDDKRLTYLRLPQNSRERLQVGYAIGAVRNRALIYLDGLGFDGWIAFLDDDDEWRPHKAERQFEAVEAYGECRVICSNAWNRLQNGGVLSLHHQRHGHCIGGDVWDVTKHLERENPVINSSAMVTTALQKRMGLQQATAPWEDWNYWQRAARLTRILRVDEPLLYYAVGNTKAYTT